MADLERRTYIRKELSLDVDLSSPKMTRKYKTINLSMVGLFLEEDIKLPLGTRLRLKIKLPDDSKRVAVAAQVIHRLPGTGIGLKFLEFEGDGKKRLLAFLGEDTRILNG
ncbi:MAG: PilZ domain-containing protein [Deltaproteobacteria bacterium]|nr:PilZ domain-containing protein [Deltaproteobacteria bacterium]